MAKVNDVHGIIVLATAPNLSGDSYTELYGGKLGCTATVNGTVVDVGPSSSIFIAIKSISGGAGCFLLGTKMDVYQGYTDRNNSILNG